MAESLSPDVCVIGHEAGGLAVAAQCALLGAPVVLVGHPPKATAELREVRLAAFAAAAKRAALMRRAMPAGTGPASPATDLAHALQHTREVAARVVVDSSPARYAAMGIRIVAGEARFTGPGTLQVGEMAITARRFVLATGSRPRIPAIAGLADIPFLTVDAIFDIDALPAHLAILGGGATGLALAQAFRRLGAEVTVFEREQILAGTDPDMAGSVRAALHSEGITLHERTELIRVESDAGTIRIRARHNGEEGELAVSHLLVAAGREPDLAGLNLEAAGIAPPSGGLAVDGSLKTSNKRIHAIGEAAGASGSAHLSAWHGGLVAQNILFRRPIRLAGTPVPRLVLTDPEIAEVGLDEATARKADAACRVLRWPLAENARAAANGDTAGHVKLIVSGKGYLLGAAIVGTGAGELIAPFVLALARHLSISDLAAMVLPHPTLSEVGKRAASTYFPSRLSNPWIGRIIRLLRRFG
jgi:pyruvate/2-oxoglutarate dehydrogenase complex dihydrolipoamide dehydrogenase (E3) component